ncbi:MAG: hypothetical protein KJ592_00760 [Nanoarchaeota archaeon]|nr:hypothetical protein [Nanoarchaeota archaeon]
MVETNVIIGIAIIIINALPIIFKRTNLLILTGAISVFLALLLTANII